MTTDYRPKILEFIKRWGPVLPVQISKELNTNILFAGAMLSELVSRKQLMFTSTKRGGSPFYYIKGQEQKLQSISSNLSGKEKEAYEVLKEKKIIRDKEATPWLRVALRSISDFAMQFNVTIDGKDEVFWRWYLLDEIQIEEGIKDLLKSSQIVSTTEEVHDIEEQKQEIIGDNLLKKEIKQDIVQTQPIAQELSKPRPKRKSPQKAKGGDIDLLALEYFNERAIKILEKQVIRKSKDSRFVVEVPSGIGSINYYVRAKAKATITEDDLMLAFGEAKQKGLPALMVSTGDLSKKAKELLDSNLRGQLIFFKI